MLKKHTAQVKQVNWQLFLAAAELSAGNVRYCEIADFDSLCNLTDLPDTVYIAVCVVLQLKEVHPFRRDVQSLE